MSAVDRFENYNLMIAEKEKRGVSELIAQKRVDLLAARSEDARVRLVEGYIHEVNDLLHQAKAQK